MFFEIDHDALIDALQDELALSGGVFGIRDQGLILHWHDPPKY
jgi:hypothetical protein